MNGFDADKYKSEINRLGIVAFEEKETYERQIAIEKLKNYFIRFYGLYLYDVFKLNIGEESKAQERIDTSFDFALKNYERIIESKVNKYNPDNANGSDLPFFSYLIVDFRIGGKKNTAREKMITAYGGMNPDIDDHEVALLNKLQRLYDCLENDKKNFFHIAADLFEMSENEIREIWSKKNHVSSIGLNSENYNKSSIKNEQLRSRINGREIALLKKINCLYEALDSDKKDFYKNAAEIFGKSEKVIEKVWTKYKTSLPLSLDASYNSESTEDSIVNCIDSGINVERQFEESDYIKEHLQLLNKIYHDSFMEKHKLAFPPHFTNEMINGWVKEYKKSNVSFDKTVETQWELINIKYKRQCYNEAEYKCISDWIYDWFEDVRKQILGKEIAERIHMSASNYKKVCDQAIELIKKHEVSL